MLEHLTRVDEMLTDTIEVMSTKELHFMSLFLEVASGIEAADASANEKYRALHNLVMEYMALRRDTIDKVFTDRAIDAAHLASAQIPDYQKH